MDMDSMTTEEDMKLAMENYEQRFMECVDENASVSTRIVSLLKNAYERGLL